MRRRFLWAAALMVLLLALWATFAPFDPEASGVVDVITLAEDGGRYYAVDARGRRQQIVPFTSDCEVWRVSIGCIEPYRTLDARGNRVARNRLTDVRLCDASGCEVASTAEHHRVLLAAAQLTDFLLDAAIIRAGDDWFFCADGNAGIASPHDLYWYDPARQGLVHVAHFSGEWVTGIRVRDLSALSERPVVRPQQEDTSLCIPGRIHITWPGGFFLQQTETGVDLMGPEGRIASGVMGFHSVVYSDAMVQLPVCVLAADGRCWLIDRASGVCTAYAALPDLPEPCRTVYDDPRDFTCLPCGYDREAATQAAIAQVREAFAENRALCDAFAAGESAWSPYGSGIGEERTSCVRIAGCEARFLHFTALDANGCTTPVRLYHITDEAAATVCAAVWPLWEELGGGWYLAALTE